MKGSALIPLKRFGFEGLRGLGLRRGGFQLQGLPSVALKGLGRLRVLSMHLEALRPWALEDRSCKFLVWGLGLGSRV